MRAQKQSQSPNQQQLRTQLTHSLTKLKSDKATVQQSILECSRIFKQNPKQLTVMMQILTDNNSTNRLQSQKEHIKLFVILAQIVQQQMCEHLQFLLQFFIRKLKEVDQLQQQSCQLSVCIADALGLIVQHSFLNVQSKTVISHLNQMLKSIQNFLVSSPQHSLLLTRIIQSLPVQVLDHQFTNILQMIVHLFQYASKGKVELLEAVLALSLSVEHRATQLCEGIIPIVPPLLISPDWSLRKMALDLLYTLAVLSPNSFKNDRKLRDIVYSLKIDKIKKVRDASMLVSSIFEDFIQNDLTKQIAQSQRSQSQRSQSQQKQVIELKESRKAIKSQRETYVKPIENTQIEKSLIQQNSTVHVQVEEKLSQTLLILDTLVNMLKDKGILSSQELNSIMSQISHVRNNSDNKNNSLNLSQHQNQDIISEVINPFGDPLPSEEILESERYQQDQIEIINFDDQRTKYQAFGPEIQTANNFNLKYSSYNNFESNEKHFEEPKSQLQLQDISISREQHTFISKEAAAILKEFKQRRIQCIEKTEETPSHRQISQWDTSNQQVRI